ncbi:MAG TPA: alpha/beta hydrolase [Thermomicrobiales bacterium]|nr:alpha/beta hydrolase [Thermomicrobiales bacterium]
MATFVLVPGAWLGGWAWRDVAARLRARGHDVFPITLTGLGERVHLARPEVDLETHITDVVNTIEWNDLDDVILAGHSYAGTVVTGVADRIPDRIEQLVYVDSAPLADGMAMTDLYPPDALAALRQTVDESGDGWRWPFPGFEKLAEDASVAGLGEREQAAIAASAVPQPWATYTQPLHLQHADGTDAVPYRRVAIACGDMRSLVAAGVPQIVALTAPPWHYLELDTGHWPMFSAPVALAEMLDELVAGR